VQREDAAVLFEVFLADPKLVESLQRGDDTAANPARVLSVIRCNQSWLHVLSDQLLNLFVQAFAEEVHQGGAARNDYGPVQSLA